MKMEVFHLFMVFVFLSMATPSNGAYCVCKQGLTNDVLQKAIDFACSSGADCTPIKPNGQCYNPNTVIYHCSYAVNNYYQKKASSGATCNFDGAATLSNAAPSGGSCSYSASSGSPGTGSTTTVPTSPITGTTPVSGGTGTGVGVTPTGTTPTGTSPYTTTSPGGVYGGGVGAGLGPTGSSMDASSGVIKRTSLGSILVAVMISGIICWWN